MALFHVACECDHEGHNTKNDRHFNCKLGLSKKYPSKWKQFR